MTKIVYCDELGGFNLFRKAIMLGRKLSPNLNWEDFEAIPRHHPALVQVVETLGDEAGFALSIKEIDEDRYYIEVYDGKETVLTPKSIPWVNVNK